MITYVCICMYVYIICICMYKLQLGPRTCVSECCCSYGTPFSNILGASIMICPIIEHSKWRKTDQQAFLQLISLSLSLSLVISDSSQYFIILLHHSTYLFIKPWRNIISLRSWRLLAWCTKLHRRTKIHGYGCSKRISMTGVGG